MKVICAICKGITKIDPEFEPGLVSHTFCRDCFSAYAISNGLQHRLKKMIESASPVIAWEDPICPANR